MSAINKVVLLAIVLLATTTFTTEGSCRNVCRTVCNPSCDWVCGRRRREVPQNTTAQIKPFPDALSSYDRDMDGMIDLEEFSQAVNADKHAKSTKKVFNIADENGDGEIDCQEFKNAPYLFGHRPAC